MWRSVFFVRKGEPRSQPSVSDKCVRTGQVPALSAFSGFSCGPGLSREPRPLQKKERDVGMTLMLFFLAKTQANWGWGVGTRHCVRCGSRCRCRFVLTRTDPVSQDQTPTTFHRRHCVVLKFQDQVLTFLAVLAGRSLVLKFWDQTMT